MWLGAGIATDCRLGDRVFGVQVSEWSRIFSPSHSPDLVLAPTEHPFQFVTGALLVVKAAGACN
jgi:hypothetical protein